MLILSSDIKPPLKSIKQLSLQSYTAINLEGKRKSGIVDNIGEMIGQIT